MALYTVRAGNAKVALPGGAGPATLILLNPATVSVKLRKVVISLDGSAAAGAVQFDLYRVATLGTPAGTGGTINKCDERDGSATSTALVCSTAGAFTTEPTTKTVIDSVFLQPLGGLYPDWQPFGAEGLVTSMAGARIGLQYTTPAAVTPDCLATFYFEE